jgi:hypothetical protein
LLPLRTTHKKTPSPPPQRLLLCGASLKLLREGPGRVKDPVLLGKEEKQKSFVLRRGSREFSGLEFCIELIPRRHLFILGKGHKMLVYSRVPILKREGREGCTRTEELPLEWPYHKPSTLCWKKGKNDPVVQRLLKSEDRRETVENFLQHSRSILSTRQEQSTTGEI